jgi:hypothetical protein
MRPKDTAPKPPRSTLDAVAGQPGTTEVPVEEQWTEKAFVNPSREPYEAERREQTLVKEYQAFLNAKDTTSAA